MKIHLTTENPDNYPGFLLNNFYRKARMAAQCTHKLINGKGRTTVFVNLSSLLKINEI
jgi:hypothetical protein